MNPYEWDKTLKETDLVFCPYYDDRCIWIIDAVERKYLTENEKNYYGIYHNFTVGDELPPNMTITRLYNKEQQKDKRRVWHKISSQRLQRATKKDIQNKFIKPWKKILKELEL
jgi:hypothetical protein